MAVKPLVPADAILHAVDAPDAAVAVRGVAAPVLVIVQVAVLIHAMTIAAEHGNNG